MKDELEGIGGLTFSFFRFFLHPSHLIIGTPWQLSLVPIGGGDLTPA